MAVDNPKQPQRWFLKPDAERPFNPNQDQQFRTIRTNPNEWRGGGIVGTLEEGSHSRSEDVGATPAASIFLPANGGEKNVPRSASNEGHQE